MIYRELIGEGSASHTAHGNLGILLSIKGELQNAIKHLNKAIRLKHNYSIAHYNLGICFKEQGNLSAAIDSYKTTIKLNPNHP